MITILSASAPGRQSTVEVEVEVAEVAAAAPAAAVADVAAEVAVVASVAAVAAAVVTVAAVAAYDKDNADDNYSTATLPLTTGPRLRL